jgi:peptidoglycan/LPS O-acetylase OafA/YrhL
LITPVAVSQNRESFLQRTRAKLDLILEGKKQKNTIAVLDGVRALACLFVIAYHMMLIFVQDIKILRMDKLPVFFGAILNAGDTGVNLFFILSGFLLFLPYARAILFEQQKWPSFWRFYVKRIMRILPAYYLSLLLMILLFHPAYLQPRNLPRVLAFVTMFMDSGKTTFKEINGPFWTLAVEWQFYLWLPFIALGIGLLVRAIMSRSTPRSRFFLLSFFLLLLTSWGVFSRFVGLQFERHVWNLPAIPPIITHIYLVLSYGTIEKAGLHGKFLENFAVGMWVSSLYIYVQALPKQHKQNTERRLQKLSPLLFVIGLLVLLSMFLWKYDMHPKLATDLNIFRALNDNFAYVSELGYGLGYGICVLALLFGFAWLKRPFEWKPLRWIGLLSYGLYMWHLLLLQQLTPLIQSHVHHWPNILIYLSYGAWLLFLIIPCMLLLFFLVERPGIQLGELLTRNKKSHPTKRTASINDESHELIAKD